VNEPVSSAAAAVTILNVDPGVNRPCVARLSSADALLSHAPRIFSTFA
jgi:hypothetical protein